MGYYASDQISELERRYGRRNRNRRPVFIVGAVVLAVLGVVWAVWAMLPYATPSVQSELRTFVIDGEHSARATFTVVRRDRGVQAGCLLRAYAEDHSIVGELNFTVGPSSPESVNLEKAVRTERRATAVQLMGCVAGDQDRRR